MNTPSSTEISSVAITASGSTAKNLPITPETKNIGMKAIIVVATEANTDGATSATPSMAAW